MSELKITKERVLDAASKCSTAKTALQTLFPEAFEEEDNYAIKKGVFNSAVPDSLVSFCAQAFNDSLALQLCNSIRPSDNDRFRAIVISRNMRAELLEKDGHQIIRFYKK